MTATLLAVSLNFSLNAEDVPQRLEEYQPEFFAQNGPLDRLKKRSAKRRWNEVRRDERTSKRDKDDKTPDTLNGNPDRPIPLPHSADSIPETRTPENDATELETTEIEAADKNSAENNAEPSLGGAIGETNGDAADRNNRSATVSETITTPRAATSATSTSSRSQRSAPSQPSESAGDSLTSPRTGEVRVPEPRISAALTRQPVSEGYEEPVRSPAQLKSIKNIMPFRNYEPDPLLAENDPCNNLCPRPDGAPCEPLPDQPVPECPEEFRLSESGFEARMFEESSYLWEPSNIFYHPPYFQDTKLERYGQTYHDVVQPFASVGRFGIQLIGLPYQMVIDQPCRKVYPLGYYRPGDCAPKRIPQIPWNARAALFQAEVVTGAFFLFP